GRAPAGDRLAPPGSRLHVDRARQQDRRGVPGGRGPPEGHRRPLPRRAGVRCRDAGEDRLLERRHGSGLLMRGSSRAAAAAAQEAFDGVLGGAGDRSALGEQLFSVAALVDANPSLRRALADPSREASAKQLLAERLFGGKISPAATVIVSAVAAGRWSEEGDLSDMLESLAVQAFLSQAESEGRIDAVEEELFRFERIIAGDAGLRDTLSSRNPDAEGKAALVRRLLEGKAQPETIRLAEQA